MVSRAVLLGILLLVLLVVVVFLLTRNQIVTVVVVPKFWFTVPPGIGAQYNLTVPQGYSAVLNGEFVPSNNINLIVAVLNDTQMAAFWNAKNFNKTYNLTSAVSYTFNAIDTNESSKVVVVDVVNMTLSPGRYHLLFYNPNPKYLETQNFTYWANVSMVTPIVLNYTRSQN